MSMRACKEIVTNFSSFWPKFFSNEMKGFKAYAMLSK